MIKKILLWFTFVLIFVFLVILFTQKDKLNKYLSDVIKSQNDIGMQKSMSTQIDSLYNYETNGQTFQVTFLEFGATGCVACRKMEFVLDKTREEYPEKVKVEFLNILKTQNQRMMKYYGIAAIPTQVLLDENGVEYFRHTGFISFNDVRKKIDTKLKIHKSK